jgi:hypothetical protein
VAVIDPTRSVIASGVNVCNGAATDVQIGRLAVGSRPETAVDEATGAW